jgi:hypothetical protein
MRFVAKSVALFAICCFGFGCASLTATVEPGTNLSKLGKVYIPHYTSDNIALENIIAAQLEAKGMKNVSSGDPLAKPADTQTLVIYEDYWYWDITMYMKHLKIEFQDAKTRKVLATGISYRPSLARVPHEKMIAETIDAIYETAGGEKK